MPVSNTLSEPNQPVLVIDRFTYAYPGAVESTLRDVSLRIAPGECHLLEGPTGAGKSTLVKAIRNLLPPGRISGTITTVPEKSEPSVVHPGLVQQNPKTQLLCSGLGADIAFGLENHCVDPGEMAARVEDALARVGLNRPLTLPVSTLSMGQQYRACLAGQLVLGPRLLLLDEPIAQLDPRGREKVVAVIRHFKETGGAVLICEHRSAVLEEVVDRWWYLDGEGRLTGRPASIPGASRNRGAHRAAVLPEKPGRGAEEAPSLMRVQGLKFHHEYGDLDLSWLDFQVGAGECVVVTGANGSGKTTLVRGMAGLVPPTEGSVELFGEAPNLRRLRGRLAVLFQDPTKQLFEATVFEEVAFGARRSGMTAHEVEDHVLALLAALGIGALAQVSPHGLSYGQKHLVGLAAVMAGRPEVLILDDPFAGLDDDRAAAVMDLVGTTARANGMAVIWTTHDPEMLMSWADRVVTMDREEITESSTSALGAVPSEIDTTTQIAGRKYRLPAGVMLSLCMVLSISAFAARSYPLLAVLSVIDLSLVLLYSRKPATVLRKSGIMIFWQGAFILLLYILRFGWASGILAGGRVAWQLFLAFWPGMIFMSACSQPSMVRALGRVLPQKAAFVSATCLRFLPMLLSEMQEIREVQILRGARILVTDLKKPRYWGDWFSCLLVPALIKTLTLADEIATAAMARDFGIHPRRTAWPGD